MDNLLLVVDTVQSIGWALVPMALVATLLQGSNLIRSVYLHTEAQTDVLKKDNGL
jgi:hypothetical protein